MSSSQKIIVALSAFALTGILLYPPWLARYQRPGTVVITRKIGHALLFSAPDISKLPIPYPREVGIDSESLWSELGALGGLFVGFLVLSFVIPLRTPKTGTSNWVLKPRVPRWPRWMLQKGSLQKYRWPVEEDSSQRTETEHPVAESAATAGAVKQIAAELTSGANLEPPQHKEPAKPESRWKLKRDKPYDRSWKKLSPEEKDQVAKGLREYLQEKQKAEAVQRFLQESTQPLPSDKKPS